MNVKGDKKKIRNIRKKKETLKHYLSEDVEYKVHDCMWEDSVKTSYLSLSYRVCPVFRNIIFGTGPDRKVA